MEERQGLWLVSRHEHQVKKWYCSTVYCRSGRRRRIRRSGAGAKIQAARITSRATQA